MLERAIISGRAPALKRIREQGVYVDDCVASFPSVTPVCAATITTGVGPDEHRIPSMNWYHREEGRYVEYGSSFSASRQFGVLRSLTDTVYRMNSEHLSHDVDTVFESLDDAGLRTAGTTYLIYRGRHQHEVSNETALARIVTSTLFRRTIDGPLELFYADLYAIIVTSDHSQASVEERIRLDRAFADFDVATPTPSRSIGAEVALSPAQRAAMIYALDPDDREEVLRRARDVVSGLEGIDLMLW